MSGDYHVALGQMIVIVEMVCHKCGEVRWVSKDTADNYDIRCECLAIMARGSGSAYGPDDFEPEEFCPRCGAEVEYGCCSDDFCPWPCEEAYIHDERLGE